MIRNLVSTHFFSHILTVQLSHRTRIAACLTGKCPQASRVVINLPSPQDVIKFCKSLHKKTRNAGKYPKYLISFKSSVYVAWAFVYFSPFYISLRTSFAPQAVQGFREVAAASLRNCVNNQTPFEVAAGTCGSQKQQLRKMPITPVSTNQITYASSEKQHEKHVTAQTNSGCLTVISNGLPFLVQKVRDRQQSEKGGIPFGKLQTSLPQVAEKHG